LNNPIAILTPQVESQIFIPIELNGEKGRVVFEVAHQRPQTKVHWHLDDQYLGFTQHFHSMALNPSPGQYQLTVMDDQGFAQMRSFEILGVAADH
jgi:penicillin-binding protein 1C